MIDNKSFCVLPWMHVAANSSGFFRLCCNSTPGKNLILDNQGKAQRLDQSFDSLQTVYNSDWMNNIRKSMMAGEKISICQRCYSEEDVGVKSAREAWNEKYGKKIHKQLASTQEDGSCVFEPIYLDLRLGNLCNLKCRMCNPYSSKKWLEDWNSISTLEALSEGEQARLSKMDWMNDDLLITNLLSVLSSVEEIYFTGGEPLLINKHFELLEIIVQRDRASQLTLKYNTNLTYLPDKVIKLWSHFKKVIINVSIDGVGRVNDYIRHPSIWKNIETHLLKLDQLMSDTTNLTGSIHTTLQLYNMEHLTELLDFNFTLSGFQKFPYINILNHPQYLNIRNAPERFKKEISLQWRDWQERHYEVLSDNHQFQKLKGTIDYLLTHSMSELSMFKRYSMELDVLRKESLSTVCPRLFLSMESAQVLNT